MRRISRTLAPVLLASSAFAGGTPENVLLIVDPTNAPSLHVANYYKEARDIPDANVLYMTPNPGTYAAFVGSTLPAFLGTLESRRITDHIDYVVVPPGGPFFMAAPGLVNDPCSPVTRFSTTSPYTLAFFPSAIQAGGLNISFSNGYATGSDSALAFDSEIGWIGGVPNDTSNARRYYLAAMLGYTGPLGNTLAEVLALIDRSVAVDGTHPTGTVYYMQTNDLARSGPRHGAYPAAVASLAALGHPAQHLFADLPLGHHDCLGVMTGLADPDIDNADLTLLPGSFADHLTSYSATFDLAAQTKLSRWIAKGASASSGAVEEPCNYSGKFPHARLHVLYANGLSLGEAWFRSLAAAPFQTLFVGDPLTRPFAHVPTVGLAGVPASLASSTIALTPSATTTHPTAQIARFELLVDGVTYARASPGESFPLETTAFADGWHELRTLAYDDTPVASVGRSIDWIEVSNHGRACTLAVAAPSGPLTQRFEFTAVASGGTPTAIRLVHNGRVVASSSASPATLAVHGRMLGAGRSRLFAEATYLDRRVARSAPIEIDVADAVGPPSGAAPIAYSFVKSVRKDQACVVELPSTFDTDLASATWTLVSPPSQASVLGGAGAFRILRPSSSVAGGDTLLFRVDTPSGSSNVATIVLQYGDAPSCPSPVSYCVGAPNSAGSGALLSASGSTSIGANDLVLDVNGLPPFSTGLFFYGRDATQIPFGNGFRCIAQPFFRFGLTQADAAGSASFAVDVTQAPFASGASALTSGSTWNFQFSYRNAAAGGAGFNLSDGLRIEFCL